MKDLTENLPKTAWYCIKCKPKQEHIAARSLCLELKIETFCPRMRYLKPTSRGPVWFVDAIFPGYIFAKTDITQNLNAIRHTAGVADIVHFGDKIPTIDEALIELIRSSMDGQEMIVFANPCNAGDEATVLDGPFRGLDVIISRALPAKDRVMILMDVLGQQVEAEIKLANLALRQTNPMAARNAA